MKESQKAKIQDYILAYNSFDIDGMTKHLSEDVLFQNVSQDQVNMTIEGVDAFREQAIEAKAFFKEREQIITAWDFADDQVTISLDYHAILAIDFSNGMKSGDELNMTGQSKFQFAAGRIIKIQDMA